MEQLLASPECYYGMLPRYMSEMERGQGKVRALRWIAIVIMGRNVSRRLGRFCNSSFQLAVLNVVSCVVEFTGQSEPVGDIRFASVGHGLG